jgi:hypothetical protein
MSNVFVPTTSEALRDPNLQYSAGPCWCLLSHYVLLHSLYRKTDVLACSVCEMYFHSELIRIGLDSWGTDVSR